MKTMMWIDIMFVSFTMLLTALLSYLSSPNQKLLKTKLPQKILLMSASLFMAITLTLLLQHFGRVSAVFVLLTTLMLLWIIPPICLAYWQYHQEKKNKS